MPVHVQFQEVLRENVVEPVLVDVARIEACRRGNAIYDKKGVGAVLTMYSGQRIVVQELYAYVCATMEAHGQSALEENTSQASLSPLPGAAEEPYRSTRQRYGL